MQELPSAIVITYGGTVCTRISHCAKTRWIIFTFNLLFLILNYTSQLRQLEMQFRKVSYVSWSIAHKCSSFLNRPAHRLPVIGARVDILPINKTLHSEPENYQRGCVWAP